MKITFHIDYRTNWGESVYIVGSLPALGSGDPAKALRLSLQGVESWSAIIEVPADTKDFEYHYIVRQQAPDVADRHEWGAPHRLRIAKKVRNYDVYDRWQDMPWDKPYYASAFTQCICRRPAPAKALKPKAECVQIRVAAPMVKPDEAIAIVGAGDVLGNWDPEKALRMSDGDYPEWVVDVPVAGCEPRETADHIDLEYKFIIVKADTGKLVAWEGGDNRYARLPLLGRDDAAVLAGMRFINPQEPWRGAGVAIPVFALRTDGDFGVGDFYGLMKMVDWALVTGQKFIQILPINDTTMTHTWTDSYPYNANSSFALHPMYLRLSELGTLKDKKKQALYDEIGRELNDLKEIDYERVNRVKRDYYRDIYAQEGAKVVASAPFKAFVDANATWLKPYAAFCVLRDQKGTCDFSKWGEYEHYDAARVEAFATENADEINFNYYLQYNLDRQLHTVREYAHSHGVAIKGDIPIGISRNSVDAWTSPQLLNLDCQAGAPPDDFSVLGQNWGFPTYNWEEMNRDGFKWWKDRFGKMAEYCDAYRIDHVLGFFRIWEIPMDAIHGLLGHFNPALPFSPDELRNSYDFWIDTAVQTRPYIMDYFLGDFFGPYTDEARQTFLHSLGYGRYELKPEFDTQRKVADYFANQPKDDKNNRLCNALMGLIDDVLFIEDPIEKGKYHPRISAQYTYQYRALNDYERWCFDRLYNDFYYHRHNDFWYGKAMWKLPPLIDATSMLCCAEDLGMIPDCVPAVMHALQILALEIQRMPKDPRSEWGNTWSYPYYSVCTTSTHDMGGIRQWWEENRDKIQGFYNKVLHEGGAAPYFAEPWVCDKIVELNLKSPSMLCILPLQDWLSIDGDLRRDNPMEEQINVPANSRHYWRYRMHLSVEQLLAADKFNEHLRGKITSAGR